MDISLFLEENNASGINYIDTKKATWQEITEYCEKNIQTWRVSGNGTHYLKKNFWCRHDKHGPDGERPCRICGPYREWSREKDVRDKLGVAFSSSSTLYMTRTGDEDETRKLLFRIKKKGGKYLSIPANEDGGKLFLLDIYDRISNPVAVGLQEAADSFMPLRNNTEWGYFSGGLGLADRDGDGSGDTISYVIPARLNVIVPKELMLGVETEAVLLVDIDRITGDNAERAILSKLKLVEDILHECGFPEAKHVGEKEISISLAKLQQTWFAAKIIPKSVNDIGVYPIGMSIEIGQTIDAGLQSLKTRNRTYMELHPEEETG